MSDDLTARLRQALAGSECNRCGGPDLDAETARLAEVVRAHLVERPLDDPYYDHITTELAAKERALKALQEATDALIGQRTHAERERDEARRELTLARREVRNLMDDRDLVCRERDEAARLLHRRDPYRGEVVRLLEAVESMLLSRHCDGIEWAPIKGQYAAFLARHQEAQGGSLGQRLGFQPIDDRTSPHGHGGHHR